jgi:hypothetical protein
MNKPSQKKKVLAHLKIYGEIDTWTAIKEMNITRLAAIISFLEEDGIQIQHTPKNIDGKHFTVYSLIKNNQPVLF